MRFFRRCVVFSVQVLQNSLLSNTPKSITNDNRFSDTPVRQTEWRHNKQAKNLLSRLDNTTPNAKATAVVALIREDPHVMTAVRKEVVKDIRADLSAEIKDQIDEVNLRLYTSQCVVFLQVASKLSVNPRFRTNCTHFSCNRTATKLKVTAKQREHRWYARASFVKAVSLKFPPPTHCEV